MNFINSLRALAPLTLLAGATALLAEPVQVGDLRISPNDYAGGFTFFDPGFGPLQTRNVTDAPFQLTSSFTGTSQNPTTTGPGDPATDIGIQGLFDITVFKNVNRYAVDVDGPGEAGGSSRIGMIQYAIDLTPLESYLTTTGETVTALAAQLILSFATNGEDKPYDIYISYTNPGEGMTETAISPDDPEANYNDLWWPAQGGAVGDVINGTHKIVNLAQTGFLDQATDLMAAYNAGARHINIIIAVPSFFSSRTMTMEDFSGINVRTDGLSPEMVGDFRIDSKLYPSFYHADQLGPIATRPVENATFQLPSIITATSQNQGGNPPPILPTGIYNLDNTGGGTNIFNGSTATVTGFGVAGIGATTADEYQFTAWREDGDFTVDVKLSSLTSPESGARAGLMVRSSRANDSAHAFLGLQRSGAPVVVTRNVNGATATETIGTPGTLPQWIRLTRTGDLIEFFISADGATYTPTTPPSATIVFDGPSYVGLAVTSGSADNNAEALFEELSTVLPDSATDIGLQTYSAATTIRTLNRFAGSDRVGIVQWTVDLSQLDDYLSTNSLNLDSLSLNLLASPSDETKPFDVYLSYTDPSEPITFTSISDLSAIYNDSTFFVPAIGAFVGEIVNETHQVLVAETSGPIDLSQDLLALYNAGVRDLNLIITTHAFYSSRNLVISEGSGLFIETSGGPSNVVITEVTRTGDQLSVMVDGLTIGETYHLDGSSDLQIFTALPDSDIVATGANDVLTTTVDDAAYYVQVMEGAAAQ